MSATAILDKLRALSGEIAGELAMAAQQGIAGIGMEKMEDSLQMVNATIREMEMAEGRISNYLGQPHPQTSNKEDERSIPQNPGAFGPGD